MSKLNKDLVEGAIDKILAYSSGETSQHDGADVKGKKRKFVETIDLQIALKNYDPQRDKRFSGTFKLPVVPRPNLKCCIIGNAVHCEEAERIGVDTHVLGEAAWADRVCMKVDVGAVACGTAALVWSTSGAVRWNCVSATAALLLRLCSGAVPELGVPSFYWGSNCLQCVCRCPPPQPPPLRAGPQLRSP